MTVYIVVGALVVVAIAAWLWTRRASTTGDRVQWMDPRKILFSLPTIYDTQPALDPPRADAPVTCQLHEDDWRQIEFVSASDRAAVEREIAGVREFQQAHKKEFGWDEIFVRKERPDALAPRHIALDSLVKALAGAATLEPLFMETAGRPAQVRGGFAIPLAGSVFAYGQTSNGELVSLCLSRLPEGVAQTPLRSLLAFAAAHQLLLVDWYRQDWIPVHAQVH